MEILEYKPEYKECCMEIFHSNLGLYFAAGEEKGFEEFLKEYPTSCPYFVILLNGIVVACGGYEKKSDYVNLRWGMVKKSFHGQGVGKKLVEFRLERIQSEYNALPIKLDTSQHSQGFYEKNGFVVYQLEKNGYQHGLDRVYLKYESESS